MARSDSIITKGRRYAKTSAHTGIYFVYKRQFDSQTAVLHIGTHFIKQNQSFPMTAFIMNKAPIISRMATGRAISAFGTNPAKMYAIPLTTATVTA